MTIRVLQVIGGTGCGGSEAWLTRVLKRMDRAEVAMDFLVHSETPGHFTAAIREAGARIHVCRRGHGAIGYQRRLAALLRSSECGQSIYDIVHSHVGWFSGIVLRAAAAAEVPVRIAHSHRVPNPKSETCAEHLPSLRIRSARRLVRAAYVATMKHWIDHYGTHGLAASPPAIATLAKVGKRRIDWAILECGVELSEHGYRGSDNRLDRAQLIRQINLPQDSIVVGHVGRFHESKNHDKLLSVHQKLVQLDDRFKLVLVGDGELRGDMIKRAEQFGLASHVRFLGLRNDVWELLSSAMDVFVFPSRHEGLGLAVVEAQAAGLPCVTSDRLPDSATVVSELVSRLSLDQPCRTWAEQIRRVVTRPPNVARAEAFHRVSRSRFNIEESGRRLRDAYHAMVNCGVATLGDSDREMRAPLGHRHRTLDVPMNGAEVGG